MSPSENFVCAHSGSTPIEAELVRLLLEEAGLFAIVPNRNTPLPGVDLTLVDGGTKLLQLAEDRP